jgi:thioredoxin 1
MNNSSSITDLTDASFEETVLKSSLPVLVDFWATWCGPCNLLMPILEEYANENLEKIKVCKLNVDVDGCRVTPAKYTVRGVPTLILFKGGKAIDRKVGGMRSKSELKAFIEKSLIKENK